MVPLLITVTVSPGLNAEGTENAEDPVEVLETVIPGLIVTVRSEIPAL
jgi:hypothetical protein